MPYLFLSSFHKIIINLDYVYFLFLFPYLVNAMLTIVKTLKLLFLQDNYCMMLYLHTYLFLNEYYIFVLYDLDKNYFFEKTEIRNMLIMIKPQLITISLEISLELYIF